MVAEEVQTLKTQCDLERENAKIFKIEAEKVHFVGGYSLFRVFARDVQKLRLISLFNLKKYLRNYLLNYHIKLKKSQKNITYLDYYLD